ncbi:MAG: hypothetical protein ACREVP_16605 [Burkholderiales bacterium]
MVVVLLGAGLSIEEVAANVINAGTGKAISPVTFRRAFREEIPTATARLKAVVVQRWANLLRSKDEAVALRAVQMDLKSRVGWREGDDGEPEQEPMTNSEKALKLATSSGWVFDRALWAGRSP